MNKKALFCICVRDSEPAKRDPLGRRYAGCSFLRAPKHLSLKMTGCFYA